MHRVGFSVALIAALLYAPSAHSATSTIDLRTAKAPRIVGADRVAAAGDVNGDGVPDALVSEGDFGGGPNEGRVYVVFGDPKERLTRLEQLGERGFVIYGAERKDYASEADGVGDLNADGLDDIVVGAFGAENNGRGASGSVYVIYGKKSFEPIYLKDFDLNIQGDQGYRIDGAHELDAVGYSVAGVDDVNGDGIDDIATVALSGRAAYVIFGAREPPLAPIDLLTFHYSATQVVPGFRFDLSRTFTGYSVEAAGDVNGDGLADIVVGVGEPEANTFVVFGKTSTSPVASESLRRRGITITNSGLGAAGVGDVNGDGLDDLVVGVSVVFGRRDGGTINRFRLGTRSYGITVDVQDIAGSPAESIGPAGDVNDDGLADLLFATPYADQNRREGSGAVYVIFGKRDTKNVNLRRLGSDGYRIDGERPKDTLGYMVAGLGDVDGDDVPDQLLSAPGLDRDGGTVYLVWGRR